MDSQWFSDNSIPNSSTTDGIFIDLHHPNTAEGVEPNPFCTPYCFPSTSSVQAITPDSSGKCGFSFKADVYYLQTYPIGAGMFIGRTYYNNVDFSF